MNYPHKRVRVVVPATSANLGPGFDCVGCAVKLYNEVELDINNPGQKEKLNIFVKGCGSDTLLNTRENLVYRVIKNYFLKNRFRWKALKISLVNHIPLARGLGSSAAACVGGLVAAQRICGKKYNIDDIIGQAVRIEGHADNVVPALLGGLCITRSDHDGVIWWKETMARDLCAIVCIPDFEVRTPYARGLMPHHYARKTAVYTTGGAAFFVSAVTSPQTAQRNLIIKQAMKDKFHQPYRKRLVSGMHAVFNAAEKAGAIGAALSGSGPSIIAVAGKRSPKNAIGSAMVNAFKRNSIASIYQVLEFDTRGAFIT